MLYPVRRTSFAHPQLPRAIALAAAVVVAAILTLPLRTAQLARPEFLTRMLGDRGGAMPAPAQGVSATLGAGGFGIQQGNQALRLSSTDAGTADWTHYSAGAWRPTRFGGETIAVSPGQVEDYLTVDSHMGVRTWSWQIDSGSLVPRIGSDGAVGFFQGNRLTNTYIKPVAILNSNGSEITPAGLRWSLQQQGDTWSLQLTLDDSKLPMPYVIDPGIVLRSGSGSDTGGNSVTAVALTMPAGVAVNDMVLAQVTFRSGGAGTTITPPASWTLIRRDDASNMSQALYYHVGISGEPGTYTWTLGSAQRASGGIIAYKGVNDSSPVDAQSGAVDNTGTSAAVAAPAVTTSVANDMLVGFFGVRSGTNFTPPAGMTEEWDVNSSGSSPASEAADALQASIGSSGTQTATAGSPANWIAQLVALTPDVTAPTNSLSAGSTAPAGSAFVSGNTVYYRGTGGGAGGNFQLTNAVGDTGSGPASSTFPSLGGTTTGWTHTAQVVSSPAGGPFVTTNNYAWTEGTNSSPTDAITSADNAGNTSGTTTLTFTNDSTNPTSSITTPISGASVSGAAVSISANSSDSGSGVGSVAFQRSPAGAGVWTTIATSTTNPYTISWDTTVIAAGLYDLRAVTTDNVGNKFTSPLVTNVTVIDITPPTNVISLSSVAPANSSFLTGTTVYYRGTGGGAGGSFQITNAATDAGSGTASSDFPALGGTTTGWSHTGQTVSTPSGGPYVTTNAFSWTEGTNSSPTEAVKSTDNVTLTTTATLTFTNDSTNPTGSITSPASSTDVRSVLNITSNSADGGSGVANATFQRSPAGAGVWTTISTDSNAPYSASWDTTLVPEGFYDLRVITTDNVGNSFISAIATNILVDNTPPTGSLTAPAASAIVRGTIAMSSDSADALSGVATAAFQRSAAGAGVWTTISSDSTNPYSINFDTTTVPDGLYDLRVVTTDNSGNVFNSPAVTNVRIDNTTPSNNLSLSSGAPASASHLSGNTLYYRGTGGGAGGSFQITNSVFDFGSGPASSSFPALGGTTTGWTHTAQVVSTPSGGPYVTTNAYTWTEGTSSSPTEAVQSLDVAGNSRTTSLTFTNDSTNPTGSVTAPAGGTNVRQTIAVTSNSADGGSGVASATFQRSPAGAGVWTTIAVDSFAPYSVNWNTTLVSDGLYDLRVVTNDNVGNTFTSPTITNVRVDNTLPTGSITAPASSALLTGSSVTVSSNSADSGSGVATAVFQRSPAGAGVWTTIATDVAAPYTTAWDTTAVADGLYDLRVITTDNAGNIFTSPTITNVRVDNTAPTGSITAPAGGAALRGVAVAVSSNSADSGSGVASATFQRSPAGAGIWTTIAVDSTNPYSVNWNTTLVPDGLYDLRVVTTDNVGLTFTSGTVATVLVDNISPTGSITSPASNTDVAGVVAVSSDSADSGSGVASATFQRSPAGAGIWTTISADSTNPYSINFDTTGVADGLYDLRVITSDNAGNIFTSALVTNVLVDNTAPTGSVTAPASSAVLRGTVAVSSDSADSGSGVPSATFQRSAAGAGVWTTISADSSNPYSINFDTTGVADGLYDLRVVTTDNSGNVFNSAAITNVRVDNTGPTGSVTAPAASSVVTGVAVVVSSDSADAGSGISSVQFQYAVAGSGLWNDIGGPQNSGPFSVSWDSTAVADGLYDLRVVATDVAGNVSTASATNVRVDNTPPTGSITAPLTNDLVSGGGVTVSSDSADSGSGVASARFDYSAAGANTWAPIATDTTAPYSIAWDTTDLANGSYDVRVVTTDNAGQVTTSVPMPNIHVDNSAPALSFGSFTNAVVSGSTIYYLPGSLGGFTVTATPWKHSPTVDHVAFPTLGTGWTGGASDFSAPYQSAYTFDGSAVAPGAGQDVTVVDIFAGVSLPAPFTVSADSTAPTTSIDCNAAPCSAGWYPGSVTVTLSAVDAGSGVTQIKYTTDGTDPSAINGTVYSGSFQVASTGTVKYRAYDALGNEEAVGSRLIQIDTIAPTGSVTTPTAGATVYGAAVNVASDSADTGGSGVASATFQYSPSGAGIWTAIGAADTTAPYSVPWNDTALAAGLYDLRVTTADGAGNTVISAIVTVRIPVALTFSAGKAKVSSKAATATFTIPVKASAAVTARATLYRGKKVVFRWKARAKKGSSKLKLKIAKAKLRAGKDSLTIVATSAYNQRVQRKLTVKIPLRF